MFKKIIAWIAFSSKDPNRLSLMLKGILTGATTYILFFAGVFHIDVQANDLAVLFDGIVKLLEVGLSAYSIIASLVGAIRKIYRTITGKNHVLNQM